MKVLVTGAGGMLASALVGELSGRGHDVVALQRYRLDVTDAGAVDRALGEHRPDAEIQGAAFTDVDGAESAEAAAFAVNADATAAVAAACHRNGALFVYPSSDYVFDGKSRRPYRPDDRTGPLNAYGRSKLAGEEAAWGAGEWIVVRTSWLYGAGGRHFVDTILRLASQLDRLEVVDDQIGRPTWTRSAAATVVELMEAGARGIFHASDGGEPVSWYGFACRIRELAPFATPITAVPTERFPRPAIRPRYSVLECSETEARIGRRLPEWQVSLARFLAR